MRAVIQRVDHAQVKVADEIIGSIGPGLLVFLGVGKGDTEQDLSYIFEKTVHLRIFEDENQKMNRSLLDIGGAMLVVSQFTLYGDCRKGRRPSFDQACDPQIADAFYEAFVQKARDAGILTQTGRFGADMKVELLNDGPVTILLDSSKQF